MRFVSFVFVIPITLMAGCGEEIPLEEDPIGCFIGISSPLDGETNVATDVQVHLSGFDDGGCLKDLKFLREDGVAVSFTRAVEDGSTRLVPDLPLEPGRSYEVSTGRPRQFCEQAPTVVSFFTAPRPTVRAIVPEYEQEERWWGPALLLSAVRIEFSEDLAEPVDFASHLKVAAGDATLARLESTPRLLRLVLEPATRPTLHEPLSVQVEDSLPFASGDSLEAPFAMTLDLAEKPEGWSVSERPDVVEGCLPSPDSCSTAGAGTGWLALLVGLLCARRRKTVVLLPRLSFVLRSS